jgi:nucleotide-binding universal stress UspA family protein
MMATEHGIGQILVGTDGSETAARAIAEAVTLAAALGARLHLVMAFDPETSRAQLDEREQAPDDVAWTVSPRVSAESALERIAAAAEEAGVAVRAHAVEGEPADVLLRVAEEEAVDVIVVGNKGMTGAKRFLLGSVPNKVSHHASCSVWIVRTT